MMVMKLLEQLHQSAVRLFSISSLSFLSILLPLFILFPSTAHAATITVCASGCTNTNTGLQAAMDAANPGDTILLQEGFTYIATGSGTPYIFPNQKSCPAQDA